MATTLPATPGLGRRTWAVLLLTAFIVFTGPSDGIADLLGQALGSFVLFHVLLVYIPNKVAAARGG